MTSKEALERLYLGIYSPNEMANYYDLVLQALERLEVLEQSNNILDRLSKNQHETIKNLTQENEKLKKAIECMKKYYKIIVCECDFPIYEKVHTYTLGIRFHDWSEKSEGLIAHIFKQEYELLKEVLSE